MQIKQHQYNRGRNTCQILQKTLFVFLKINQKTISSNMSSEKLRR